MNKPRFDPDLFRAHCQRHGIKITPQRAALYRELMRSTDHPSADVLFRRVRKILPHISFDTVNRTLLSFASLGLIRAAASRGNSRRYDPLLENHHHVHCTRCDRIIDFKNAGYDRLALPKTLGRRFRIAHKTVVLEGICDRCGDQGK